MHQTYHTISTIFTHRGGGLMQTYRGRGRGRPHLVFLYEFYSFTLCGRERGIGEEERVNNT